MDHEELFVKAAGSIDGLARRRREPRPPTRGEVQVAVRAIGLNFRDVLSVLGLYPGDPGPLGLEHAGVVLAVGEGVDHLAPGDRVLAIPPASFATIHTFDARLAVRLPDHLSFEDAATFPVAFLTVMHALEALANIREGQRVLIHAAAGGVGMAAIEVARAKNCEIFGTAHPSKWALVLALGVKEMASSRNCELAAHFIGGVDVVLNSLSGFFIPMSLDLLTEGGAFVELGKKGTWSSVQVARRRPDVRYFKFDLGELIQNEPDRIQTMLREVVARRLRPLPKSVYPLSEAERAFSLMHQGKHAGKIVFTTPGDHPARSGR